MKRNFKYFSLLFICLICLACGLLILFTPQLKNIQTDAKTISTTIYLYASGGALKDNLDATKNTLSVTSDRHTYSIYGPGASYNVKQGTDGPDPDFDWGHAFINSSSILNSSSTSGSASSSKNCAVNLYLEGFRSYYYDVYANIYADGDFEKKVTNFDSYADANYHSSKNAQLAVGNWGNVSFKVDFYVSPKATIAKHYHKYYSPDVGTTTSYIGPVKTEYGKAYRLPATSVKTGYHFQEWRDSNNVKLSTYQNNADCVAYTIKPYFYAYCPANEYDLNFDANGGSVSTSKKKVYYDSKYGPLPTPTRTGYSFLGWYTSASGGTYVSSSTKVTTLGNRTIYAHWVSNSYTVTADVNGEYGSIPYTTGWTGSGSIATKSINYDSTYDTLPTPTRKGYNFTGWYTEAIGGTVVSSSTKMTTACDHTIYAHWTGISYSVRFNCNFSPPVAATSQTGFTYGTPLALQRNTFVRPGYTFKGWATSANGGVIYSDGASVSELTTAGASIVDLYAVWEANTYKVTANANGGSFYIYELKDWVMNGNNVEKNVKFNSSYGHLPLVNDRTGYDFDGWYTDLSGGSKIESNATVTIVGNHTLYAHWTPKTINIYFNSNGGVGNMESMQLTYNSAAKQLTSNAFSRNDYLFKGWNTSANGSGTKFYERQYVSNFTNNITLFAQWDETWNTYASSGLTGSGTINDPYLISCKEDLAYISKAVANGITFAGKYFKQTESIDLSGRLWLPIGSSDSKTFQGNYDGNGYLITNLTTSSASVESESGNYLYSNVGLFGYTRNATIKNVNIISGTIRGYDNVGSIVGNLNNGSIENCRSGATVTGHNNVGMIGFGVSTSILSSYNYGSVNGNDYVGGILGRNGGTGTRLENCYMKGSVTASASNADCGGILGQTTTSGITLQSCGFIGSVTGGSNTGLLTGNLNGGSVIDCFANSTTNYAITKGSGTVKSSLYIQNKDNNNIVKKYVTHSSETNPFANWTLAVNDQPLPKGFSWISSSGGNLTMEKLAELGYTAL